MYNVFQSIIFTLNYPLLNKIRLLDPDCCYKFTYLMAVQIQIEANWSGSTLFAKAGYIQVQQDKG